MKDIYFINYIINFKNKIIMMKTLRYFFVAVLAMVMGNVMAEESFDFTAQGYENAAEVPTINLTNVTITWDANGATNAPKWYNASTAVRIYAKNKVTFTATKAIKVIKFTLSGDGLINENNNGFDSGEYDFENTKWTGSTTTLVLHNKATSSNQIRIQKLTFYYEGDEIPGDVHIANTPETAYTVAKAFELIDAGEALSETVYVKGVISKVDGYNDNYKSITYWISDNGTTEGNQLECYSGKGINGADFASAEDVATGATVIVKGTLAKFNSTYEFSANNELYSYEAGGDTPQPTGTVVGIERPKIVNPESGAVIWDTWAYIGSVDLFNKSVDGLTAKFFQSANIEATIVKDETQEGGYEMKSVCHQGEKNISLDYCWKLNCADYDGSAKRHKTETLGSEGWQFGFDLTVADGCSFAVSAIDFDLMVEQNPSYRIRIMNGETEVYNSTWITKTGGYNSEEWGAGSYCRITKDDVSFLFEKEKADGEGVMHPINYQAIQYYPGFEEGVGTKTPLGDLTLAAGTYRVVADVDFNKDSAKAMSFDNFTLEGTLSGTPSGIEAVKAANKFANGEMYNLSGQKVGKDYKGIVIMNGKKMIMK